MTKFVIRETMGANVNVGEKAYVCLVTFPVDRCSFSELLKI